ncbi:hypothetical protein QBL07_017955 [Gordonia rubripertincta]|uniref:Uncharacterized protein n=1 Tax=Gordonia rubripertincta TaxID=36822 RepID=A0AAW6R5I9_GORRU|nr:hypothetical protein [Gordonia rubripertincta]MDG6779585.1 hypothetical protein [Gordonia rubripertincta]NKY62891.1 hypothetical protein [Gordonia rubripertincta]
MSTCPPDDGDYSLAAQFVWYSDPTTSSYRDEPEQHFELARPGEYYDEPETLRPVITALLQRIRDEFADAPPEYQKRVLIMLRYWRRTAPRDFEHRDTMLAAMLITAVLKGSPTDLGDDLLDRRLVYTAATAADVVIGLIGTELERRNRGQPPDPHVIID